MRGIFATRNHAISLPRHPTGPPKITQPSDATDTAFSTSKTPPTRQFAANLPTRRQLANSPPTRRQAPTRRQLANSPTRRQFANSPPTRRQLANSPLTRQLAANLPWLLDAHLGAPKQASSNHSLRLTSATISLSHHWRPLPAFQRS